MQQVGATSSTASDRRANDYLDGIRGVGCIIVILYHAWQFLVGYPWKFGLPRWFSLVSLIRGGFFALTTFMVLSGYLLTLPVVKGKEVSFRGGTSSFMERRAWRILPPYATALALSILLLLVCPFLLQPTGTPWDLAIKGEPLGVVSLLTHTVLIQNLWSSTEVLINPPLWSVALEWQIYFIFAFLLVPIWRRYGLPVSVLFRAIRQGKADVVTDSIEHFTTTGIKLTSGKQLDADIIVTATGLNLQLFGGAELRRNGVPVALNETMTYKGMMLSGVPNMAFTIGYTNASWTLKADLVSEFVCRVLNYMDARAFDTVVARHPGDSVEERPLMDFTPGYVLRALDYLPKAGERTPWRLKQNYLLDLRLIRHGKVDDDALQFTKHRVPVGV